MWEYVNGKTDNMGFNWEARVQKVMFIVNKHVGKLSFTRQYFCVCVK